MAHLDPINEFREDHRKVRDGLIDIIGSLQAKDVARARGYPGEIEYSSRPSFSV
jgi:hypothetical protein